MTILSNLERLGLSPQEAAVYLALMKVGESSVGAIISQTGFHRDLVYGALSRLEQQGLVQSLEKKKIRHYQAADPALLARRAKEKAELAASILPQLHELFTQPVVSVRIYEGVDGLEEIEKDWAASLKDGEEFYAIGGAGKAWYDLGKHFGFMKYHKRLYARGIRVKTVTYPTEVAGIRESELPGFNPIRVLPEEFNVPSSTIIYADKILIQIFGEQYVGVMVQSKAVSDSYRQYFQVLWAMGKDV
jgi:sugar-specific transcriptional regulator TrmB